MWLGLSESLDIYLGQGVALLKRRGVPVQVFAHPKTWPLQGLLDELAQAIRPAVGEGDANSRRAAKPLRLNIALSGALCPAGGFAVPSGLRSVTELQSVAGVAATQMLGQRDVRVAVDMRHAGLMAGVSESVLTQVHQWTMQQNFRIASLQPIWSIGSQCALVRPRFVKALVVVEPDSVTLLAPGLQEYIVDFIPADDGDATSHLHGKKQRGDAVTFLNVEEEEAPQIRMQTQMDINRWLVAHALTLDDIVRLGFSHEAVQNKNAVTPLGNRPKPWASHWRRL